MEDKCEAERGRHPVERCLACEAGGRNQDRFCRDPVSNGPVVARFLTLQNPIYSGKLLAAFDLKLL
jgi:hypothetical protein